MNDGSYSQVYYGNPNVSAVANGVSHGDIIYYTNGPHSALITSYPSAGLSIAALEVTSKWGEYGLFKHAMNNVPYYWQSYTISVWH